MKLRYRILAMAGLASTSALISCSGPASYSYNGVKLTLTPSAVYDNGLAITTYPVNPTTGAIILPPGGGTGSCIELTVSVTNAPINPSWYIIPTPNPTPPATASGTTLPVTGIALPGPQVGTVASPAGANNFYCEPNNIPIYTGPALVQATAAGIPQGNTEVLVTNPADPNNPANVVSATQQFEYGLAAPPTGVLIAISPLNSVTVPLKGTYQFSGYVAGIVNTAMTWQVNGVTGGSATYGTISATGLYTAPAAYPSATVHSASITATSVAYNTIVSAITTVNFP